MEAGVFGFVGGGLAAVTAGTALAPVLKVAGMTLSGGIASAASQYAVYGTVNNQQVLQSALLFGASALAVQYFTGAFSGNTLKPIETQPGSSSSAFYEDNTVGKPASGGAGEDFNNSARQKKNSG